MATESQPDSNRLQVSGFRCEQVPLKDSDGPNCVFFLFSSCLGNTFPVWSPTALPGDPGAFTIVLAPTGIIG